MDELTKKALLTDRAKLEADHVDSIIETVKDETTGVKNEAFNKLFNDLQRTKKYMFVNFFSPIGHVGLKATDVEMREDDRGKYIAISLEGYNHAYIDSDYEIRLRDYCDNHIKYTVYPSVSRYKGECFDICIEFLGGD